MAAPVRKAVSSGGAAADVEVYAEGVRLMKARSKADRMDPLGWFYQSRMHGRPGAGERGPGEPMDWSNCQHGSWFFLPWHRMYLLQFERIIRSETGEAGFALPYWDYPDAPGIVVPPQFEDEDSPLFNDTRSVRPSPIAPETWRRSGTFVAFGGGRRTTPAHRGQFPGAVEQNPHNPVHGFVGGDMGDFQSPLDALFWIHHCNIDRLWEIWLRLGRDNPKETSWSGTSFDFPDPDNPDGRRRLTIEEVATTAAAGYSYDDLPPEPAPPDRAAIVGGVGGPPRRDDDLELLGASAGGGSVREPAEIRVAPRARSDRLALAAAADESSPPLFLRLENVGVDAGDASAMWNVYVRAGEGERHLAGTIAPFGLAGLTASGGRQTLTMDISHLSDELLGAEDAPLEVSFEPVYDDVEGEPFWERAALYTTAG
jgi:tyrosinase